MTQNDFLTVIARDPTNDDLWLQFADWLDDNLDEAGANYVRRALRLNSTPELWPPPNGHDRTMLRLVTRLKRQVLRRSCFVEAIDEALSLGLAIPASLLREEFGIPMPNLVPDPLIRDVILRDQGDSPSPSPST